ncbi:MAG TPA: hypothetical protein VLG69_04025 [Candidatus Andersenbacteria bacterium]|nr:hypothetical protein [Candidatus Andersenbacteria bacterium]
MEGFQKPWFVCGGWAIDLFLNQQTRQHADVDVGIFREDQQFLREYLNDWQIYKVVEGEAINLKKDELLELPIHELKALKGDQEIEILLNNSDATDWVYRREETITYPKEKLTQYRDGIPYWAPEISLLYKTKETRSKDEQDFANVLPHLSQESRQWLKSAIEKTKPGHGWLAGLW